MGTLKDIARSLLLPIALLAVSFMIVVALSNGILAALGNNPQFSFTMAGVFAIYLATSPGRRSILVTAILAFLLRSLYGAAFEISPYFGSLWISSAAFAGLSSLIVLVYSGFRTRCFKTVGIAGFFLLVFIAVGFILPVTNRLAATTLDTHLLVADGAIGFQLSFFLGCLIDGHSLLRDLTNTVYAALPLPIMLLCALQMKRKNLSEVYRLLGLFGVMSLAGYFAYVLCPATGPIYAFASYPTEAPHLLALVPLPVTGAPRNAIPSLHFCAAILLFWNTSKLSTTVRLMAGLFLAATGFAVLALGEHYLVDLLVAVPFALVFEIGFTRGMNRLRYWTGMGVSLCLTLGWLLMLRFGEGVLFHSALICCLYGFTFGVSVLIRQWTALPERSAKNGPEPPRRI